MFAPVMLPVAVIKPPVIMFAPVMLPVAVINPAVPMLPIFAFPDTDSDASVPVLVMFGCAAVITVPDVVAFPETFPIILATRFPDTITDEVLALIV